MVTIGKILTGLLALLLTVTIVTNAQAASNADLEAEIEACRSIKDAAHQMAEGARGLGFDDDHEIIQIAKERWAQADDREQELARQLETMKPFIWDGSVLTRSKGVNYGPSGKETYYNLPMGGVVRIMRNMGFDAENYPYWVREDGVKMLGDFVLCACNLSIHPRGSLVDTSLGKGMCADTGGFAKHNPTQIDIATSWG